ncbi:ClpXP protease specificity-enhancing factor SspB [Shigella flexneri]
MVTLDNQLTPHLVVDVTLPGMYRLPMEYARDGQIALDVRRVLSAIWNWRMMRYALTRALAAFRRQVSVPLAAVLAIYARENSPGTMFEPEAAYDEDTSIMNDEEASADDKTVMSGY